MNDRSEKLKALTIDRDEFESPPPRRLLGAVAALLLLGGLGVGWFLLRPHAAEFEVAQVHLEQPTMAMPASSTVLDATGYVVARLRATVSSKITGKLVDVRIEEGTAVASGQVLATLDDSTQRRQLALAEAQVRAARERLRETEVRITKAELDLERTRSLVHSAVVGQAELDRDQAEYDSQRARLEVGREEVAVAERQVAVARQSLDDTVIRAPFSGVAVTKDAQPGEMISPVSAGGGFTRTGICTLVDMGSLEIEVDVNEAYINRVRKDQPVEAVLDAYPDWRIPARVITTIPTADRQRATVRVRVGFLALDPRILPEMGVKVAFLEAEPVAADAGAGPPAERLVVDARAVRTEGDETFVFLVREGKAVRRLVKVGPVQQGQREVREGLADGDRVIVNGGDALREGDSVHMRDELRRDKETKP